MQFIGVHVIDGWFTGLDETRLLSATQAGSTSFTCATNPIEIRFPEPASEIEFDLITPNDAFTISDDTGFSRTLGVRAEFNGTSETNPVFYRTRFVLSSTGVNKVTITNHCSLTNTTGCREQWRTVVDNLQFQTQRYCLAIFGALTVEPNPRNKSDVNLPFVVEVTDCNGTYVEDIEVETSVTVKPTSGGHSAGHAVSSRPTGGLRDDTNNASGPGSQKFVRMSDPDGLVPLQFVSPEIAGTHTITAKCTKVACDEPDPPLDVDVKIDGLTAIPPAFYYTLTEYLTGTEFGKNIGDNGNHDGENHNLTPDANAALWSVAFQYAALHAFLPVPEKLHLNDASLPWGGLFDIKGGWAPNHVGHRKGVVVDVRANDRPGAVPADHDRHFMLAVRRVGATAVREFAARPPLLPNPAEHYHLKLLGVDQ